MRERQGETNVKTNSENRRGSEREKGRQKKERQKERRREKEKLQRIPIVPRRSLFDLPVDNPREWGEPEFRKNKNKKETKKLHYSEFRLVT